MPQRKCGATGHEPPTKAPDPCQRIALHQGQGRHRHANHLIAFPSVAAHVRSKRERPILVEGLVMGRFRRVRCRDPPLIRGCVKAALYAAAKDDVSSLKHHLGEAGNINATDWGTSAGPVQATTRPSAGVTAELFPDACDPFARVPCPLALCSRSHRSARRRKRRSSQQPCLPPGPTGRLPPWRGR